MEIAKKNIAFLVEAIMEWSQYHGRADLPWRHGINSPLPTPYEVWVSEIMLQQTQVTRVIPFYQRFLERFPNVKSLADTTWEEFLPYYAGLGYYRRGRNMLKTAQIIEQQYQGKFLQDRDQLLALPGIGQYTANAILSFGFGQPHLAFDTNQQRVLGRFLQGDKKATLQVEGITAHIPADTEFRQLNGAIMDFANGVCLNRQPHCEHCPLQAKCVYAQTQGQQEATTSTKAERFPHASAVAMVFLHENHQHYYSSTLDHYQPFILPQGNTSRHQIQAYFQREYRLDLAVRPPFAKGFRDAQPTLLINAQILLGQPDFSIFDRAAGKAARQQALEKLNQS